LIPKEYSAERAERASFSSAVKMVGRLLERCMMIPDE
jgi:hypothetical protein